MVKVAKPKFDFTVDEEGEQTTISVKAPRTIVAIVCVTVAAVFFGVGFIALFVATAMYLTGSTDLSGGTAIFAFVCVGISILIFFLAQSKRTVEIVVDSTGITSRGTKYLFDNIESIGVGSGMENVTAVAGRPSDVGAVEGLRELSYYIFIEHGTKKMLLINGLSRDLANRVHETLQSVIIKRTR